MQDPNIRPLHDLINTIPQSGILKSIAIRPGRSKPMVSLKSVETSITEGIIGDRFKGTVNSKRQVTLMQAEHLPVIASLAHRETVPFEMLRRNLLVGEINLLALKNKRFNIGDLVLEGTGLCHPCSKMEKILGAGGYNAMRGHGGITARVIQSGTLRVKDEITLVTIAD